MSPESFRRCPAGQNAWRLWVRDCVLSETAVMELFLFPFQWAHMTNWGRGLGGAVDLPYDTCHLCKRLRIDGIKVMSRGILGGKQVNLFPRVFSLSNMAGVGEKIAGKNVPVPHSQQDWWKSSQRARCTYQYLNENGLLNSGQSGFRSLHSTLTALLETNDSWCVNIGRDLLNDLKKDFDAIDHEIILKKLTKNGVDQDALKWFKSYLTVCKGVI